MEIVTFNYRYIIYFYLILIWRDFIMRLISFLTIATLTTTSALADGHASGGGGAYGFLYFGTSDIANPQFSGTIGGQQRTIDTFFSDGTSLGLGVGYNLSGWGIPGRGEIEFGQTEHDINNTNFSGNGPGQETASGGVSTTRVMLNYIYDIQLGGAFTPSVGLGIGSAQTDLDIAYRGGPNRLTLTDDNSTFSYQVILGGAYSVTKSIDITADVKYIVDGEVSSQRRNTTSGANTGTASADINNTNINIGLRYNF